MLKKGYLVSELAIGVDIGGTRTKSGLIELTSGQVLHSIVQPTATNDQVAFIGQLEKVIDEYKELAAQRGTFIKGIGIGVPGFTREDGSVATTYGFLEFMENFPLKSLIEKRYSLSCMIDNDARVVALGEAIYGKGKNFNRVLTLTLGTGVGFGMLVNGRFTDPLPLAHMGGHMTITSGNERCYCGKTGCLEYLVSSVGIERAAKQFSGLNDISAPALFAAAAQGNGQALAVIDIITGYLHTAIHNYSNLFAPDIIVLGGGIAKGLAPYLEKIKGVGYLSSYPGYSFDLVVSDLGEHAGMLGSAGLFQSSTSE